MFVWVCLRKEREREREKRKTLADQILVLKICDHKYKIFVYLQFVSDNTTKIQFI